MLEEGLESIRNSEFAHEQIDKLFKHAGTLQKEFGADYTQKLLMFCGKLYGHVWKYKPNIFKRAYNKLIVRGIGPYIKYWHSFRNIFLIGSEDAGNLGDHQIALSMHDFFPTL